MSNIENALTLCENVSSDVKKHRDNIRVATFNIILAIFALCFFSYFMEIVTNNFPGISVFYLVLLEISGLVICGFVLIHNHQLRRNSKVDVMIGRSLLKELLPFTDELLQMNAANQDSEVSVEYKINRMRMSRISFA